MRVGYFECERCGEVFEGWRVETQLYARFEKCLRKRWPEIALESGDLWMRSVSSALHAAGVVGLAVHHGTLTISQLGILMYIPDAQPISMTSQAHSIL